MQKLDLATLSPEQLVALVNAGLVEAPKGATKTKGKRKTGKSKATKARKTTPETANVTGGFELTRDPRSDEFGVEYGFLKFLDGDENAHSGKLREDDTLGHELVEEIKSYAKAHAVGRSRMRYNVSEGRWQGRMDLFPARLRKLAGI